MEITRVGSRPSAKGPPEWFTGAVRIDPLLEAHDPARAGGASVTFEPGARTAPHRLAHPPTGPDPDRDRGLRLGAARGRPDLLDRAGDVIWFPPGEKHWHGATATTAMTHIAIQEALDGKAVEWLDKVSDDQCRA